MRMNSTSSSGRGFPPPIFGRGFHFVDDIFWNWYQITDHMLVAFTHRSTWLTAIQLSLDIQWPDISLRDQMGVHNVHNPVCRWQRRCGCKVLNKSRLQSHKQLSYNTQTHTDLHTHTHTRIRAQKKHWFLVEVVHFWRNRGSKWSHEHVFHLGGIVYIFQKENVNIVRNVTLLWWWKTFIGLTTQYKSQFVLPKGKGGYC